MPWTLGHADEIASCAGIIVYHGPREDVVPFFDGLGFEMPERKGVADFLQEITSRKDQKVRYIGMIVYIKHYISHNEEYSVLDTDASTGGQMIDAALGGLLRSARVHNLVTAKTLQRIVIANLRCLGPSQCPGMQPFVSAEAALGHLRREHVTPLCVRLHL